MFKNVSLALAILIAFFGQSTLTASPDLRKEVIIRMPANATVYDVFASKTCINQAKNEWYKGFNLPSTPQFDKTYTSFPDYHYSALYTTNAATLTLASLLRFIDSGYTLFTDQKKREEFYGHMFRALSIRRALGNLAKLSTTPPSQEYGMAVLLVNFVETMSKVEMLLKELPLQNQETKALLEKILSTPTQSTPIKSFLHSVFFHFRSKPATDAQGNPIIQLPWLGSIKTPLLHLVLAGAAHRGATALSDGSNLSAKILRYVSKGFLALTAFSYLANIFNTSANLAPEPGAGIKVVIELEPSKPTP